MRTHPFLSLCTALALAAPAAAQQHAPLPAYSPQPLRP